MKKTTISLMSAGMLCVALAACDSKTSANEKNFGAAVSEYFGKKGEMCLDPLAWPVDVYEADSRQRKLYPDGVAGQMAALEAAGLASGADMELAGTFVDGKPSADKVKVRRYTLADAAKPWLRTDASSRQRLCWGRKSLAKVVRWSSPAKVGDHQEASVIYTYQLSDVSGWARMPQVKEAFPVLGRTVDGERTQKEKLYVKLTPQGWEALGLND